MTEADRAILSKRLGNADVVVGQIEPDAPCHWLEVRCRVGDWAGVCNIGSALDITAPGPARSEALEQAATYFVHRAPHLFPVA